MTTLMTTSPAALGGLLAMALAPAFWPGDAAAHTCDDPFSTGLIAGRTIDAGDVKVCNDDTTLTVTYEAMFPWCLLDTNLHVATIPEPPADPDANIPQNGPGNPIPGHFAYGDEHDCVGTAVFEIPLDEIDGGVIPGDTVVIAAKAEVEDGKREEGAWGEGQRFVARGNWAMYFTYEVQEAAVPCPEACVAGLNDFARVIGGGEWTLFALDCDFDTDRQAGTVFADYITDGPPSVGEVRGGRCLTFIEDTTIVDTALSPAEQATCAPLAVDILPLVDETNCDISPR